MRRAEAQSWKTRPPAVAGTFYPYNPDRLQKDVWDLLAEVAPPPRLTPKALIAPHAGYIYSGGVAAAAFATLRDSAHAIKRVVLIGPAHYVPVPGIAVPAVSSFETIRRRSPRTCRLRTAEKTSHDAADLRSESDPPRLPASPW